MKRFDKDPDAVIDYTIKWSKYLATDTISTSSWILDDGITKDSDTNDTTSATIWLSGGTAKTNYTVTNRIVTAAGITDDRSIIIRVMER